MDKRRRYVQTTRAASAQATRERILEAAEASFERGPLAAVRIDDVARRAGVSRSTVYQLFGDRAGLLVALAERLRQRAGFDRLMEAFNHPDARESFRLALRESCRMFAAFPELSRSLFTLAGLDEDAVAAVAQLERGRRPGMRALAVRLHEQGQLREGVSVREATELLTVVTSFPAFDELFRALGLPHEVVADRLIAMGERAVCRDA
ncbi:MAG TPA: helix-turn-helix domain-containing protein [Candidatus Limnocylindrales bacterium]|jgi:AcrR family transcriptional regulator|nr:helix-turn-helix domain-containing protein [Candidatus Limnocylindrales bacterium]